MLKTTMAGLAVAATALAMTTAQAADLPARPMYTKAAPAVEVFNWTGFYIGANIGFGEARSSINGFGGSSHLNGVLGGGQIGYNWQGPASPWIFGIEIDGQGTGQDASATGAFGAAVATLTESLPWFMTARGRIGYAVTPMIMIYGTGGAAVIDHKFNLNVTGLGSASSEDTRLGWTAGAGIEGMFTRNWSWKVEYLHLDTGSFNTNILGVLPVSMHVRDDIGRFGVNYHF